MATTDIMITPILIDKLTCLKKYGYEIETLSTNTGRSNEIRKQGFIHHELDIDSKINIHHDVKSFFNLYQFLRKNPYDIIHTHNAKAGIIGRIAGRLAGIPIVIHTTHGLPFYEGQINKTYRIYREIERVGSLFCDGYFSQNIEDLERVTKLCPRSVISGYEGNGVNLKKIDHIIETTDKEKIRHQFQIPENTFVFFMGARLVPVKNHQMLLRAVSNMNINLPFVVILAGEGELENSLKRDVEQLGLSDKVKFIGYQKNAIEIMQIADAVLLTSSKEGIPRILMEAMASKKPILATDVLGTRELVVKGKTGELIPLHDYHQLTSLMTQWLDIKQDKQLKAYGLEGRKRIEAKFTEEIVAERIHCFYQELLNRKGVK